MQFLPIATKMDNKRIGRVIVELGDLGSGIQFV